MVLVPGLVGSGGNGPVRGCGPYGETWGAVPPALPCPGSAWKSWGMGLYPKLVKIWACLAEKIVLHVAGVRLTAKI